jgi:hypothetical protein
MFIKSFPDEIELLGFLNQNRSSMKLMIFILHIKLMMMMD